MKLRTLEVAYVLRDEYGGASCYGELDEVVIGFIPQIGSPGEVDRRPAAEAQVTCTTSAVRLS